MRSSRWIVATSMGFALTGIALHSPGASAVGNAFLDWDISAAVFGAILGTIAGSVTGILQIVALRIRTLRVVAATAVAVAIAHALADGAPAVWGVPTVAALSGVTSSLAFAWAVRSREWRSLVLWAVAWCGGWLVATATAGGLGLSGGSDAAAWMTEHAVIGTILGLAWGAATSPATRRILGGERALSSAG